MLELPLNEHNKHYVLAPLGYLIYDGISFHTTSKLEGATTFHNQEEAIKAGILYCSLVKESILALHFLTAYKLTDIPINKIHKGIKS